MKIRIIIEDVVVKNAKIKQFISIVEKDDCSIMEAIKRFADYEYKDDYKYEVISDFLKDIGLKTKHCKTIEDFAEKNNMGVYFFQASDEFGKFLSYTFMSKSDFCKWEQKNER